MTLRDQHFAAGDALHDKQGAFYAANAEVTRLEQQLAFARENETRLTEQVAQLTEAIGALTGQQAALDAEQATAERGARRVRSRRASARRPRRREAQGGLPALESAVADAAAAIRRDCSSGSR